METIIATLLGLAGTGAGWIAINRPSLFARIAKAAMLGLAAIGLWVSGYSFGSQEGAGALPPWIGLSLCGVMAAIWLLAWISRQKPESK